MELEGGQKRSSSRVHSCCFQAAGEGWVRSLSNFEEYYMRTVERGADIVAVTLSISTAQKLSEATVTDAYLQLFQNVPNLQVCIHEYGRHLWFRRRSPENLNNLSFHEEPTLDLAMQHHQHMLHQNFSRKDPLWRLRVVNILQQPSGAQTHGKGFKSILVFGFHHAITDGTSNFKIAGYFLSLLENAIQSKLQETPHPNFSFSSSVQTDLYVGWEVFKMLINPWAKQRSLQEVRTSFDFRPKLFELRPSGQVDQRTCVAVRHLDEVVSSKFACRCKQEGMTIHSGFSALLNLAHAVFMEEAGLQKDSPEGFIINSLHTINMRRYWWGDVSNTLGAHVCVYPLEQTLDGSNLSHRKLWSFASQLNKKSQEKIANRDTCRLAAAYFMLQREDSYSLESERTPVKYFTISNMGSVDKFFPSTIINESSRSSLHLDDVMQSSSVKSVPYISLFNFHTFKGRFLYMISYSSEWMSDQTAHALLDTIEKLFFESIKC